MQNSGVRLSGFNDQLCDSLAGYTGNVTLRSLYKFPHLNNDCKNSAYFIELLVKIK